MPVTLLEGDDLLLTKDEVGVLWEQVRKVSGASDDAIGVRGVSEEEMVRLNGQYRSKEGSTNVLTFSYDGEHDVALCLEVARREAMERGLSDRDYVALLLTHAFLHATGMDHEHSPEQDKQMARYEEEVLKATGFETNHLSLN